MKNGRDGAAEAMLTQNGHGVQIVKKTKDGAKKKEDYEALQSFLRSISSQATLPGYVKGNNYSSTRGVINQCLVAGAVLILAAAAGHPIGFSAIAIPQMKNETENGSLRIDDEMGSWIASIHSAATPLGSMISGPVMEAIGRKRTLQSATLPLVLGWVLISSAAHLAQVLVGRVVCGFAVGLMAAPSQVYLGEISEPRLRGMLIGLPFVAYSLGVLYVYALGVSLHWKLVSTLSIVLPVLSFISLCFSPESPTWLARRGQFAAACASIACLRGDGEIAQRELHELISAREKEIQRGEQKVPFCATISKIAVFKPLLLILIFNTLQIMCGTYIVIFYALDILERAANPDSEESITSSLFNRTSSANLVTIASGFDSSNSTLSASLVNTINSTINASLANVTAAEVTPNAGSAAIVSAVVRTVVSILACFLLFHMRRRTLSICSGIGTAATTISLAIILGLKIKAGTTAFVLIMVYVGFNTLGFFMLPGLMIGELLPAKVRGLCGGYIFFIFNAVMFGFTKVFPLLMDMLGVSGIFWIFGVTAAIATILLYLFLPETKGKSLLEIERYYQQENLLWLNRDKSAGQTNRK